MLYLKRKGFTLIEMTVFIVVIAVIITTVLLPVLDGLPDMTKQNNGLVALWLAQERMELILSNRRFVGYSTLADPCDASPSSANCSVPTGFTVTSSIVTSGSQKNITVTVSGSGNAVLNSFVASY